MSNSTHRDGDISKLHPVVREKVQKIREQLHKEKIPFEVFEACRTPQRQAALYARGRTRPGTKVTWVGPWKSIHQYGLAVDFVLCPGGNWSWDDKGAEAAHWKRMHELAEQHGMRPIRNSKGHLVEKPHIQLADVSASDLYRGGYPDGGDTAWAEYLAEMIDNWSGPTVPPPKPALAPEPPGLPDDIVDDMEAEADAAGLGTDIVADKAAAAIEAAEADARFQRLHAFVKLWEGDKFVDHPEDKGGPTKYGITQATLANWRGRDITAGDVRRLTREEADAILRANYYNICRCGEMPERTAAVVYNGAVLHGPRRSVEFLQRAFNDLGMTVDGAPLEVDGDIGRLTIAAARQTDAGALAKAYMDIQDTYFRQLSNFDTFGAGWLNRLAALRDFVSSLPQGAGKRPKTTMEISDRKLDLDLDTDKLLGAVLAGADNVTGGKLARRAALASVLESLLDNAGSGGGSRDRARRALLRVLVKQLTDDAPAPAPADGSGGKPPLTPVNAALGDTIGYALDGKKSVIGIVGLILTVILPKMGLPTAAASLIIDNTPMLITLLATFTGWGFLGKIDKAIASLKPPET